MSIIKNKIKKTIYFIQIRLELSRFFVTKKRTTYHPLPWIGLSGKRNSGAKIRLEMVLENVSHNPSSFLDIGCAEGYYAISLADKGHFVVGVDGENRRLVVANAIKHISEIMNVGFVNLLLTRSNVESLPRAQYVLCFSIWHHWVKYLGFDDATQILASLWGRTDDVLFFETGLSELTSEFNAPIVKESDQVAYLEEYLLQTCENSSVSLIGFAPAFSGQQFRSSQEKNDSEGGYQRPVFKIQRILQEK